MKLHTVFITYNRLELTKQAVASYLETVSVPYTLMISDNGSDDGTREWIAEAFAAGVIDGYLAHEQNMYPGYACNRGFELAPDDADFLHRADNDWTFLPDWCARVQSAFRSLRVGQVGLRTDLEESRVDDIGRRRAIDSNVGGNMVLRRKLWDRGLRYDERPWTELPMGLSEDSFLSPAVKEMGYRWRRVRHPCIVDIGIHEVNAQNMRDPYYRKSWADRGIGVARPRGHVYRSSSRRRR